MCPLFRVTPVLIRMNHPAERARHGTPMPPPRALKWACAYGHTVVLGGGGRFLVSEVPLYSLTGLQGLLESKDTHRCRVLR